MVKPIIFLDLDGVIADFETHAETQGKYHRVTGKLDREALDHQWWSTIPVFDGAQEFYETLQKIGDVKFLTGPMLHSGCHSGKAEWIENFDKNRGKWALRDLIICPAPDKHLLSGPGRILIDDRKNNIADWRLAGGIGILHEGDFDRTLEHVKNALTGNG
ncbi:MAG: hypothetical protein EA357_06500 [Micavibrio sp.]|nr:MAG: hypothetical protein EA357_06500 [Micavibrio sp.]